MVKSMNGEERGASLWKGREIALLTTCGYLPEKGTDLLEEGLRTKGKFGGFSWVPVGAIMAWLDKIERGDLQDHDL